MITEKEIREWYHSNDTYFGNSEEFLKGILIYLKQKGVIKKSALEEARLHYEYIDSFYKRKMSVLITDVIVLKDKYEQAIDEKEAEIERLKGGNGQERTQGQ